MPKPMIVKRGFRVSTAKPPIPCPSVLRIGGRESAQPAKGERNEAMSDLNWAEQAEAILKRRRSIIKEFAKLTGEARVIAEANAEESFKREMRGAVGPWPQTAFINTTTPYYGTTMSA